ncbi:MAG TPA: T9SS type A sorting domain-containing protein [Parafilimonas sp.]|nr:T9SS type A sorting domain-containing protein [Parafilimonas sp.]
MKIFYFFLFVFTVSIDLKAQIAAPQKQWDKRFGTTTNDMFSSLQQTKDNGFILGGTSSGIGGDKTQDIPGGIIDYWILKTDSIGMKEWDKTFGGTGEDQLYSLIETKDSGYVLFGSSGSSIGYDKSEVSRGRLDYWVIKTNSAGTKIWDKTYGGSEDDIPTLIQQTSDGGYILGGYSLSGVSGDKTEKSRGYYDYWIVKIGVNGMKEWDRRFGGNNDDKLYSLQQTSDGGYILGGYSLSNISGDKTEATRGNYDYWIVKIDANGLKQWDRCFGGSKDDQLYSLQQTTDGGYILGGYSGSNISGDKTENSRGAYDYWVIKINSNGLKQWDKRFGGMMYDFCYSIHQTADSGYILGGVSQSNISGDKSEDSRGDYDYWIVKIDANGNKQWDKCVGGKFTDILRSVDEATDGGYILGGYSNSEKGEDKTEDSRGSLDYWIVKLGGNTSSTIEFFNKAYANSSSIKLASATIDNVNPSPIKICADGSRATYIEYTNKDSNILTSNIRFRIFEDITGLQKDRYGYFDMSVISNDNPNIIRIYYNHPTYMDQNSVYRTLTMQVYDTTSGKLIYAYPIQIYRAPLLMVHGLMGHRESFEIFEEKLFEGMLLYPGNKNSSPLTYRLDYSISNTASFETNKIVVKKGIDDLLTQARDFFFSAGKVDVLAHSMGGVVSRLYIQNPYGCVPYRDDVHKLITFNTPHSGTQLAAWGTQTLCPAFSIGLMFITRGLSLLTCPAFNYFFPAFSDLSCDSYATDKILNGSSIINTKLVPTKALTSTTQLDFNDPDCWFIEERLAPNPILNLFKGEQNDGVVPLSSQQGGISPVSNIVPLVCHINSMNNGQMFNEAIALINDPPSSSYFDVDGYVPLDISYQSSVQKHTQLSAPQTISFTTPADHASFKPGQVVRVRATGSAKTKSMQLMVGNEIFASTGFDTTGKKLLYNYTIPSAAAGEIRMIVFGFDSEQQYVFDTVRIYVTPTAKFDSISVYPTSISTPENLTTSFEITGYYHDGYARNISSIPDIIYKLNDTAVAVHTFLNEIKGKNQDTTSLTISYLGKSKTVPVHVLAGSDYLHAGFLTDDTLICRTQQVHFTNYSTGNPDSVKWVLAGAIPSKSTEKNPVVVYNKTGMYDAKLICYFPEKNDTLILTQYIRVINKAPGKVGVITISKGNNKACPGDTISYSITAVANTTSYLWKVPVGATILQGQGTTSINVSYSSSFIKTDSVSVAAVNSCGTGPTKYSKIILKCNQTISDYSSSQIISKNKSLIVFPNPFSNTLYVKGNFISNKKCQIIFMDVLGKIYFDKLFIANKSEIEINTANLQKGFYFLIIQTDTEKKILKAEK